MTDIPFNAAKIRYSTPHVDAIKALLRDRYVLPASLDVTFLRRGFNDSYLVHSDSEKLAVLRLSGWRARGPEDVESETDLLAFLDEAGVPVAAPIPTRDGRLFSRLELPQGERSAVLFRYAEGEEPGYHSVEAARAQGVTMARIHDAAEKYPRLNSGTYRLDLDHLLHRPLASVLALGLLDTDSAESLTELASRLSTSVTAIDALTWVSCHGDCHGGNARIAKAGPLKEQAIFFDFDDGGPGYLAYDLAVFLWAQTLRGNDYTLWHAFIKGYRGIRSINPIDFEATHLFVPIRHFWLMGNYASRTAEWGSEAVTTKWLTRQIEYMLKWEREKLVPGFL
ncbi:phosphotransferase enzyme family protein [Phyllobacterium sp. K27]